MAGLTDAVPPDSLPPRSRSRSVAMLSRAHRDRTRRGDWEVDLADPTVVCETFDDAKRVGRLCAAQRHPCESSSGARITACFGASSSTASRSPNAMIRRPEAAQLRRPGRFLRKEVVADPRPARPMRVTVAEAQALRVTCQTRQIGAAGGRFGADGLDRAAVCDKPDLTGADLSRLARSLAAPSRDSHSSPADEVRSQRPRAPRLRSRA